jgi:hypothetical protein
MRNQRSSRPAAKIKATAMIPLTEPPSPTDAIHNLTERPLRALGQGYFILPFEYCLAVPGRWPGRSAYRGRFATRWSSSPNSGPYHK